MKSLQLDKIRELLADGDGFTSWGSGQFRGEQCPDYAYVRASTSGSFVSLLPGATEGVWLSPKVQLSEPLTADGMIVPWWQADTPIGTHLELYTRVRCGGMWDDWRPMFDWAGPDAWDFQSHSMPALKTPLGSIEIDSYVNTTKKEVNAYQLMVILYSDGDARPTLFKVGAQAMNMPTQPILGPTTMKEEVDLPVPEFSQYLRASGKARVGGEGFCSPTSITSLVRYFSSGPNTQAIQALDLGEGADAVDHAARYVYDYEYGGSGGAGNWPFNTAYAASFGLDAVVRRFRSLRDLEALIKLGVPVAISLNWDNSRGDDPNMALAGASRTKSGGHLLVVRGFTKLGDVIVNEPANVKEDGGVKNIRRIYLDYQVNTRWQEASGGIAYVAVPRRTYY